MQFGTLNYSFGWWGLPSRGGERRSCGTAGRPAPGSKRALSTVRERGADLAGEADGLQCGRGDLEGARTLRPFSRPGADRFCVCDDQRQQIVQLANQTARSPPGPTASMTGIKFAY